MTPDPWTALAGAIALAFAVEAALGFGATLLAVSLGTLVLPLDDWLPTVILLNLPLSCFVLIRDRHAIHTPLLRRVLPLMALGLPLGTLLLQFTPAHLVPPALGLVVLAFLAQDLLRQAGPAPLSQPRASALLLLGGIVHGLCGSGGPLAVYVADRHLPDPRAFRATLATVWVILNGALLISLHRTTPPNLHLPLSLLPPTILGCALGDLLHQHLPPAWLRRGVRALLLSVGLLLTLR